MSTPSRSNPKVVTADLGFNLRREAGDDFFWPLSHSTIGDSGRDFEICSASGPSTRNRTQANAAMKCASAVPRRLNAGVAHKYESHHLRWHREGTRRKRYWFAWIDRDEIRKSVNFSAHRSRINDSGLHCIQSHSEAPEFPEQYTIFRRQPDLGFKNIMKVVCGH
ncbi:hypothetical protein C8R45DRAFT_1182820 [Mycena sanguinolenta]|nr:hypothetical protein C8R45DRAFT_1182820 [Mycena sanguinolenta]